MADNVVGTIPDFTPADGAPAGEPEVKVNAGEEVKPIETERNLNEKDTQPIPPVAEVKPIESTEIINPDAEVLLKQVNGLTNEREKLLQEIQSLRGVRREIKKDELVKVDAKIDELKDLHPDDVKVVEKILKAKGYVTKDEADKIIYNNTQQDELDKFLSKYPEYKPDNDKHDINWNALQRELQLYRMPTDPHQIQLILERAHNSIQKPSGDRTITTIKQKIAIAGVGSGGTQRSSSSGKTLSPRLKEEFSRGGWSDEEITKMESRL